jgi:hypothetical protein
MPKRHPEEPIQCVLGPLRMDLATRAIEAGCQVLRVDARAWHVTSSEPERVGYLVTRDPADLHYVCECEAGQNDLDCKHAALVLLLEATGAVIPILPPLPAGTVSWDQAPPQKGY